MTRIGWIGTGVMGAPMAGHLLDAGHELIVHTRTRSRAESLLARGATWAETPADAASQCEIVCSIVGMPDDVRATHLGPDGTLAADQRPELIIDLTTSAPELAREIATAAEAHGIGALDAPVSGGDVGAQQGTLSIMVGGRDADVARARPVLEAFGANIVHQGPPGAGQHTKMVNQILIASGMVGVCEGLLYAQRAGLDPRTVIESVGSGAAGSWSILNLGPRIVDGNFDPGFFVEHFIKDLGIALTEAERMQLALPGLALARQLYEAVRAQGHARLGTHALYLALEQLNAKSSPT